MSNASFFSSLLAVTKEKLKLTRVREQKDYSMGGLGLDLRRYTVKKVNDFPFSSGDVTN